MSVLAVLLVVSFASVVGLILALAFARAVLYANVLTELDENARWLVPAACARPAGRSPSRAPSPKLGPFARRRELRKSALPV